jgi:CarD family transcriptional regulator
MRKLSADDVLAKALETLAGRARVKRTMWSRRAQEYEAKINSGDLVSVAEVVRDLHRAESQPEQSYSERQLYEAALDRMARELAAVEDLTESESVKKIEEILSKSPKRAPRNAAGEPAVVEAETDEEAEAA